MPQSFSDELYHGLNALAESSFPKKCMTCGKTYLNTQDFVKQTENVGVSSGLKASHDDDEVEIVELFRNCLCGSTLMDVCGDRRNNSASGKKRRQAFNKLLQILEKKGVQQELGRREILKVMAGQQSTVIQRIKNKT